MADKNMSESDSSFFIHENKSNAVSSEKYTVVSTRVKYGWF